MELERDAIKTAIRNKVISLANELGEDASDIEDDDIIPATGLLELRRYSRVGRLV